MDSPVPLMHHDPDRSWITDPDHPKGTQPNSHKCIRPKHFRVTGNVVTTETSQILLHSLWHLRKIWSVFEGTLSPT